VFPIVIFLLALSVAACAFPREIHPRTGLQER